MSMETDISAIKATLDNLDEKITSLDTNLTSKLNELNISFNLLIRILFNIQIMMKHFHEYHLHNYPHENFLMETNLEDKLKDIENLGEVYSRYNDNSEKKVNSRVISDSPVMCLMQEILTSMDLDGNKKIYGKDFIIHDGDPRKPDMLKKIEGAMPIDPGAQKIMLSEYLEKIGWEE